VTCRAIALHDGGVAAACGTAVHAPPRPHHSLGGDGPLRAPGPAAAPNTPACRVSPRHSHPTPVRTRGDRAAGRGRARAGVAYLYYRCDRPEREALVTELRGLGVPVQALGACQGSGQPRVRGAGRAWAGGAGDAVLMCGRGADRRDARRWGGWRRASMTMPSTCMRPTASWWPSRTPSPRATVSSLP
jgi:hypothetical protein